MAGSAPCALRMQIILMQLLIFNLHHAQNLTNMDQSGIRFWNTQLLAQYSNKSNSIVILFQSVPLYRLSIGVYEIKLVSIAESRSKTTWFNATWEQARHDPSPGAQGYTLLTIPMNGYFWKGDSGYKLHMRLLIFRNHTEICSIAKYSQISPGCHVTFRLDLPPPPTAPGLLAGKSGSRCPTNLTNLTAWLEPEFGLRLNNDGCCLVASDNMITDNTTHSTPICTNSDPVCVTTYWTFSLGAILLLACSIALVVKMVWWIRRTRLRVEPSEEPYSLLAINSRCVHHDEPLIGQMSAAYQLSEHRMDLYALIYRKYRGPRSDLPEVLLGPPKKYGNLRNKSSVLHVHVQTCT